MHAGMRKIKPTLYKMSGHNRKIIMQKKIKNM